MKSCKQELVDSGFIWKNFNGKWCKKCSLCFKEQSYSTYSICLNQLRKNISCNICAKTGNKNPAYGKSPSLITRKKLSISGKGKHKIPCPLDKRIKISNTKHKNNNGLLSQNGNNQFKRKQYIFPDGRIEWVQGYEPWTIDMLLSESISPNDIIIKGSQRPVINYTFSSSINNRYLPDCFIPKLNTIVETKSTWTWNSQLERNLAKISGSTESGYITRFIIWERNKNLINDFTFFPVFH